MRTLAFVGRYRQLVELDEAWRDVEAGSPRVVVFGGPAGIGKTRLLTHFADRIEDEGGVVLRTACSSAETGRRRRSG